MVSRAVLCWLIGGLVVGQAWGNPVPYQAENLPLALVTDLTSRIGARPSRLAQGASRIPPALPQDLEAIKKVAQILIMLGQQVIPAIIGDPMTSPAPGDPVPAAGEAIPNDPVNLDKQQISS